MSFQPVLVRVFGQGLRPCALAAAALCTVMLLPACSSRESRIDTGLRKAQSLLRTADWDKAGLEVRNVLQIDPKSAQAYFVLAQIEEGRRELQRAYAAYGKVLELAPSHMDAKLALARIYLLVGDVAKAQVLTQQVLAADAQHGGGRTLTAALRLNQGDLAGAKAQARAVLDEALVAKPARTGPAAAAAADASMLLAGVYANAGDPSEALRVVEAGLRVSPDHLALVQVAAQVAAAAAAPGRDAASPAAVRAVAYFRRSTELAPKNNALWNAWAAHHAQRDELDAAEAVLRTSMQLQPDDSKRWLAWLDFLATRRGQDMAIAGYLEAIAARPRDHSLRLSLAEQYRRAGRLMDADRTLEEVIQVAGETPAGLAARNRLALIKLGAGQIEQAKTWVAEVLKANPRDGAALVLRGRIHLIENRASDAVNDFRAASRDQPGTPEIIGRLAQAHRAAAEPALAREVLAQAARDHPNDAEMRLLLAADLIDSQDFKQAAVEVEAAIRAAPQSMRVHDTKALLAIVNKDPAGAEKVYRDLKQRLKNDPAPALRLGQMLSQQRRFDAALKEFDAAAAIAPGAVEPKLAAVALLISQRRFDAAQARIDALLRAEPRNVLPHQLSGDLALARGLPARAEQHYARMIELAPGLPAGYVGAARAMATQNNAAGALAVLQRGEGATAGQLALPMARAQWLARWGRKEEAIAVYESLLLKAPDDDELANNLAFLLAETRRDPASLQRALALASRFSGSVNATYLDSLGWVHYRMGEYRQAVQTLDRAVRLAPDSDLLQLHMGLALLKAGEKPRGQLVLRPLLEKKPPLLNLDEARVLLAEG